MDENKRLEGKIRDLEAELSDKASRVMVASEAEETPVGEGQSLEHGESPRSLAGKEIEDFLVAQETYGGVGSSLKT
ncbi:uncharacterized protein G2W53_018289 [Senna tora]|uniref:Uncharacterized protein n=1 Tax=Senna tora TaxID=362788 RepID=A0A834TVP1_9FABA|nr:uncharacterized protein G2W53_018289 [Senna tora]